MIQYGTEIVQNDTNGTEQACSDWCSRDLVASILIGPPSGICTKYPTECGLWVLLETESTVGGPVVGQCQ